VLLGSGDTVCAQSGYPGEVVNDRFIVKSWESGSYVFTIGEIQNNIDATLDDIVVEARFFDTDGELIDVTVERLYSLRVPPSETVAFRLQSMALAERDEYVSHEVRLISASESRPCAQSSGTAGTSNFELIKKLLISSFPILLLLAAWIYFMRRAAGKNSPQNRSLDLIDRQNDMIEKQGSAIERIANALEAEKRSKR
jgi:hypothetical protein